MAGRHEFALLAEFEENDVPRLRNTLTKYFQSKKSCGGECEVDHDSGSGKAVVRFRKQEDQRRVLAKESHQIVTDKVALKITVRPLTVGQEAPAEKPTTKSGVVVESKQQPRTDGSACAAVRDVAGETADEGAHSASAVLGKIPATMNFEFLEMLIENILDSSSSSATRAFTLELLPDTSSAVVTFQSEQECADFVTRCPQNNMFKKKQLLVQPLELTQQVLIEDVQELNEDYIYLYVENAGVEVEKCLFSEDNQSAILTLKDHKAVQKIVKQKLRIKEEEFRLFPFYQSLGTALYGKEKHSPKLPAAISEHVENGVWSFLNHNQPAEDAIHSHMAKHFCNVNLKEQNVRLSPVASLLQQKDAKVMVKQWREMVKSEFAKYLSNFKSVKLQLDSESWDDTEKTIRRNVQTKNVVVVPDKAGGHLVVAGHTDDVDRLERSLFETVNKITEMMEREKSCLTKEIKVSQAAYHVMCLDGFEEKLLSVYPHLKMTYQPDNPNLIVTGLMDEILELRKAMCDQLMELQRQNFEADKHVLDLLKNNKQEELTNALFKASGLNAAFEKNENTVRLVARNDRDLKDAVDHLNRLLISECVDGADKTVLNMPEWNQLVSQLEDANVTPFKKIRISVSGQQVVVSGLKDEVAKVKCELGKFLTQNTPVEKTVAVRSNAIIEYIQKSGMPLLDKVNDNVTVWCKKDAICLSGRHSAVSVCKTFVEKQVASVAFQSFKVSNPGAKKIYKNEEAAHGSSILKDTGCVVQLVDETTAGQGGVPDKAVPKPVYQNQTSHGVEMVVCKADLFQYPVHAVVCGTTEDLKNTSGLAKALVSAAGPQLQLECDQLITSEGQLKSGECVIMSSVGQLCCKNVIFTVAPRLSPANVNALAKLKIAIIRSLRLAELHGCTTVAMPIMCKNQGVPIEECAATLAKAVMERCKGMLDDSMLKKIHFVDKDDDAIQVMAAAVRKEFGNDSAPTSQQAPSAGGSQPAPVNQAVAYQNCLGHEQTKEGLNIILVTGNIENATTDVIVNTVFDDLDLTRAAVSKAILGVAGPNLQEFVTTEAESKQKINDGDIVITEGGLLYSQFVYHAVTPNWDKGKGTAQKILSGIFKECLDNAEKNSMDSISLPAIGTGNLGYPKDLVASLMLDEILAFSQGTKPVHLKEVVIMLFPGDGKTLQVFCSEFQKRFPKASPTPANLVQHKGCFSKVVSSSGQHETKLGNVVIQAVTGDITKETSDIIVNSSNDKFTLKSGVSEAILEAAGQAVEDECKTLGNQPNDGIIMTQPGNLQCKNIIHVVIQSDADKIKSTVKKVLQMCITHSHSSISFPAIGTGQGKVQVKQVADAMLDAVIEVVNQNSSSTLQSIRIVIFQLPMLKDFYDSMQERHVTGSKPTTWLQSFGNQVLHGIKAMFASGADKPKKVENHVIETLNADPACFHICGESQAKVNLAKKKLQDLISDQYHSHDIPDNAIQSLSKEDCQSIAAIQRRLGISISTKNIQEQLVLVICGHRAHVFEACTEINAILRKAKEKRDAELAGLMAAWQYQSHGSKFKNFNPDTTYRLEQALKNQDSQVKVTIEGKQYIVQMPQGPATDNQGGTLEINRIDLTEGLPHHWDTMSGDTTCVSITLNAGTQEYSKIQKLFGQSCAKTIIKIERIQNKNLWKSFEIKKGEMDKRNGHTNNDKQLFHGTNEETIPIINERGFNRSYAGKNAACYGNGSYFAVKASYSAQDTYAKPNPNGEKFVYVCRVLSGEFALGKQGMVEPPIKASTLLFDSVVDNMTKPSMFVIFHDANAYPEYLITFK
ncbi:poly(ADP-ribose) polymerase family member 14-related sequence 1 isoform X2 [Nelusetta ayraudi]|uniref:poly(ADP-ribose) polymerase family member 14-related sequence 1 isoform X2 n=1 Tax=Nelusetta ayraudi TaxID=303726 RepID=UPI003F724AA3